MFNNDEMKRLKKCSHILRIMMDIIYRAMFIVACLSLIAAIAAIFMPDSFFTMYSIGTGKLEFIISSLKFDVTEAILGISMKDICITILFIAFSIILLIVFGARKLARILRSVDNDTPFKKENADRIRAIGMILILSSFLVPAYDYIPAIMMMNLLKIKDISLNYSVNISLALAGILMFILSGIFRYGSYLQDEYDGTV